MEFSVAMFWVFAAVAVISAAGILLARSIVHMALLLLFSLGGFAGLYLQLGAGFVGFTQVLVYIGGILVLFLFGVMLTVKMDVPLKKPRGSGAVLPGILAGLVVVGCLLYLAAGDPWNVRQPSPPAAAATHSPPEQTPRIGTKLMSNYILPFEAVSVLLLAAMVGATYIARGKTETPRKD